MIVWALLLLSVAFPAQAQVSDPPAQCLELDSVTVDQVVNAPSWDVADTDVALLTNAAGDSAKVHLAGVGPDRVWTCKLAGGESYVKAGRFGVYRTSAEITIALEMIDTADPTSGTHVAVYDHPLRYYAAQVMSPGDLRWANLHSLLGKR